MRAEQKDDNGPSVDWDASWQRFQRETRGRVSTQPPPTVDPVWRDQRDMIRRSERTVLDFWSSEAFAKVGIVATVALFVTFLLVAGPPPSDGRCTLPWC